MSLTWLDQATRSLELPNRHSIGRLCLRRISNYQRCEMRTDVIVPAILLMPWNVAFAQTACPQGVAAGSAQCGPSSLVNPGDSDYRSKAPALPPEHWSDSWGAIAKLGRASCRERVCQDV